MMQEGVLTGTGNLAMEANPNTPSEEQAGVKDGDLLIAVRYKDGKVNCRIIANSVYGPDGRNATGDWRVHDRELEPLKKALDELMERHKHRALARSRQHAAASYNAAVNLGEYSTVSDDAEEGQS